MARACRRRRNRRRLVAPGQQPDPNRQQIFSTKDRLDKLTIPMIYLYGLEDVMSPVENGFNQEDVVPNIQFFYPDECGHQGQTDQPEVFNQVALEFFSTGKVTWPTAVKAGVSLRRPILERYVEAQKGGFPKPNPGIYAGTKSLREGLKALNAVPAWAVLLYGTKKMPGPLSAGRADFRSGPRLSEATGWGPRPSTWPRRRHPPEGPCR